MPSNVLGCGHYTAQVWTRGGSAVLFTKLPVSSVAWDRRLDDTSEATVSLAGLGRSAACFAAIRNSEPFQYELAVVRDSVVVWQGPLVTGDSQGGVGTLTGRDLSAWWDRRKERYDRTYVATELADIFQQLADDAMTPDPSPNITVATSATGITGDRKYLAGQHLMIGAQLRELSTTGIDWTVFVRDVLAGGLVVPTDPIVRLDDRHIVRPPAVRRDGLAMGTAVTMIGAGGGEGAAPVVGYVEDTDAIATYGLIDVVSQNDNVRDSTSAAAAATSTLALKSTPVTSVSDLNLDSSAPILMEQLVPGALIACALKTSGIVVAGTFRVSKVAVTATAGAETVTITIQPVGSTTQAEGSAA